MTNLPPPSFGPPGGPAAPGAGPGIPPPSWSAFQPGTPGGPGNQPLPYVASPPPPSGGRKKIAIATTVALLAISGVAAFVLTRDDDSDGQLSSDVTNTTGVAGDVVVQTGAPTTDPPTVQTTPGTTVATTNTATESTEAPTTTAIDTTTTTTVIETTTTSVPIPVIPDGAIDLGNYVYIPVPAGWTLSSPPGSAVTLTDATVSVSVSALTRPPGENPAAIVQEYVNTFDAGLDSIAYSPTVNVRRLDGEPAVDVYNTYYEIYEAAANRILAGSIQTYVRGDGLTLIYEQYGPTTATATFPIEAADAMRLSVQKAPPVNTSVTLTPVAPFRVTSVHPFVQVDGLVGFTAPPGFRVITSGANRGFVTNDIEDFQVDKVTGQADTNAVVATAQSVIAQNYTGVSNSVLTVSETDLYGIIHGSYQWSGTYVGGNVSAGAVDVYFDPATTNAYVIFRTWFTGADANEPFPTQSLFMLRSVYDSFTTIP